LGLLFPLGTFPKKFRPDPSTFYLVIVVTNKQTDKQTDIQTNAGKNIIPRFRGDNKLALLLSDDEPGIHPPTHPHCRTVAMSVSARTPVE